MISYPWRAYTEPDSGKPRKSLMNVKGCVFDLHDDMQIPKSNRF